MTTTVYERQRHRPCGHRCVEYLEEERRSWKLYRELASQLTQSTLTRTDELAVLLAGAITGRSWSSPRMFGCRRGGAASMACTLSSIDVCSAWMGGPLE